MYIVEAEHKFIQTVCYFTIIGVDVYLMERSPKPCGEFRSPWALKKVQKLRASSKKLFTDRIEYEADILKNLSHPNIIGFRAFSKTVDGGVTLAMERASRSLGDIITERNERVEDISLICRTSTDGEGFFIDPFPASQIQTMALDIAKALEYLHQDKKLIHV
jgi:PDZ-binding kinase